MTLGEITRRGIDPALALLPAEMDSAQARVMLLATGLQESRFEHRRQIRGPARGFWQFEEGGGVTGAMRHKASRPYLKALCALQGVEWSARAIMAAIEHDDILAAGLARLLYWTDALRLPAMSDTAGAWRLYLRTWRPGKPHPETWPAFHRQARLYLEVA